MRRKGVLVRVTVLLVAVSLGARAQTTTVAPSVTQVDPPPGNAMSLSIPEARAMLKQAINRRYVGEIKLCTSAFGVEVCPRLVVSEARDIHVSAAGFRFEAPYTYDGERQASQVSLQFEKLGVYIQHHEIGANSKKALWRAKSPSLLFGVGGLPAPDRQALAWALLLWTDEATAQSFADAFNRLMYVALNHELDPEFIAGATVWRATNPKPPLSPEADRHWILAENAFKEKNLASAVEHYEAALEIQPMWPTGWFNLAMIHGELTQYADASDAMKHYLELVPDAPDAKSAREQMIIWDDKAKQ